MSKIQSRLSALQEEQAKGKEMLANLERETDELRATLLRIAGAIQVLEELSEEDSAINTGAAVENVRTAD